MKKQLVVATANAHKLHEYRCLLGSRYEVLGLADVGCSDNIPEDADTFEGNALAKARWLNSRYGLDCIADDSGLEVRALGWAPGVRSARYAGAGHDDAANNRRLLSELEPFADRYARFRTCIALVRSGQPDLTFDGMVEGEILTAPRGDNGFGYDPLFRPAGWQMTFGEASDDLKNSVSHRSRAAMELLKYLDSKN